MRRFPRSPVGLGLLCLLVISACSAGILNISPLAGLRAERGESRLRTGEAAMDLPAASSVQQAAGTPQARTIRVGDLDRQYYSYVPPSLSPGAKAPLVLAFHGGGGEALGFAERTGLFGMADRQGFVLMVPQGIRDNWANGSDVGYADRSGVDDLALVDALIAEAEATLPVQPGRTFAVGLSAGGMMTYRAACELPGRLRAIAVVAATLAAPGCSGGEGVSVLHIHGTDDQSVPLAGGAGAQTARRANYPSVESALDVFERRNACGTPTASSPAQDTTCEAQACQGGVEVEFCAVEGGGHGWPGIEANSRQERNGSYISPYFDATDYIAQFFLQH